MPGHRDCDVTIRSSGWRVRLRATLFQTKLALYTSYVIAGRVRRGTVPDALFWDTAIPISTCASSRIAITTW